MSNSMRRVFIVSLKIRQSMSLIKDLYLESMEYLSSPLIFSFIHCRDIANLEDLSIVEYFDSSYRRITLKPEREDFFFFWELGVEEEALHKKLSYLTVGFNQLNPYTISENVSDKLWLHKRLKDAMPPYIWFPKGSVFQEIKRKLHDFECEDLVIVKPRKGTEGWGVRIFPVKQLDALSEYISKLCRGYDVILEKFIRPSRSSCNFVVRIASAFNGETFKAESSFSILAETTEVASYLRGGRILSTYELFTQLGINYNEFCHMIKDKSQQVSYFINRDMSERDMLKYMGIDLVFSDEKVFVIDVNPRPSGLQYLRSLENPEKICIFGNLHRYIYSSSK